VILNSWHRQEAFDNETFGFPGTPQQQEVQVYKNVYRKSIFDNVNNLNRIIRDKPPSYIKKGEFGTRFKFQNNKIPPAGIRTSGLRNSRDGV